MKFADQALRAEDTKVRHLIFLADGADTDTYGSSLSIVNRMRQDKITTTVIAIGDGKDVPFLKQLAAAPLAADTRKARTDSLLVGLNAVAAGARDRSVVHEDVLAGEGITALQRECERVERILSGQLRFDAGELFLDPFVIASCSGLENI